jgi:hypothetical protein
LPIIRVPCLRETSAYMTASAPLIHVGDTLTVTGAIVNECSQLVHYPRLFVNVLSPGILAPINAHSDALDDQVVEGQYHTFTVTLQAIGPGEVTLDGGFGYETIKDPPWEYWASVSTKPITIRVVPNN